MNDVSGFSSSLLHRNLHLSILENSNPKLFSEHNKIMIISALAVAVFGTLSYVYYCFFSKSSKSSAAPILNKPQSSKSSAAPVLNKTQSSKSLNKSSHSLKPNSTVKFDDPLTIPHLKKVAFDTLNAYQKDVVLKDLPKVSLNNHSSLVDDSQNSFSKKEPAQENKGLDIGKVSPASFAMQKVTSNSLAKLEEKILLLKEDLSFERQLLNALKIPNPKKGNQKEAVSDVNKDENDSVQENVEVKKAELKVANIECKLSKLLKAYPALWTEFMNEMFDIDHLPKDNQEIYGQIVMFSGLVEQFNDYEDYIYDCLKHIDSFLIKSLFTSNNGFMLLNNNKVDFFLFRELFSIIDKYFKVIESKNPLLAKNLKIKLANLPIQDEVSASKDPSTGKKIPSVPANRAELFPNVYLSAKEQLNLLVDHFQKQEEKFLNDFICQIPSLKEISNEEFVWLLKIVLNNCGNLSSSNLMTLQENLTTCMGSDSPANWHDANIVGSAMNNFFKIQDSTECLKLQKLYFSMEAKQFFANQMELEEEKIQIPSWYYTANHKIMEHTLNNGKIALENHKDFKGVKVSKQVEATSDTYVFALNSYTTELDPNVWVENENHHRGLHTSIPLVDSSTNKQYVALIGVDSTKPNVESEVTKILQDKGYKTVAVVSNKLLKYMQNETDMLLGKPNLIEKWWGSIS